MIDPYAFPRWYKAAIVVAIIIGVLLAGVSNEWGLVPR